MTPRSLLLVEPTRLHAEIIRRVASAAHLACDRVEDVVQALARIQRSAPTCIIAAMELPGLGGPSLLAALKASPLHRAIPLGLVSSRDPREVHGVLPDGWIMRGPTFTQTLGEFFERFGLNRIAVNEERILGRVLLAEDAVVNQKLMGHILHVAGAEVTVVENGAEALALASREPFDLLLLDLEMPIMTGLEAARTLRELGHHTPMVAVTGHTAADQHAAARAAGFDEVLVKPTRRAALLEVCRRYLAGGGNREASSRVVG